MAKIRISLIFPRLKYFSGDPPLGIAYLASYAKKYLKHVDVTVIDTTFKPYYNAVFKKLKEIRPHILGIYSDEIMTNNALLIAGWAQTHKICTVFGGPQPTAFPEAFIPYADIIVRGEGEMSLLALLQDYPVKDLSHIPGVWWKRDGEIVHNAPRREFINLDNLPFPQRDLLPFDCYIYYWSYLDAIDIRRRGTTMMVSRGCPFSCSYCQPTIREMFGQDLRFRSPDNVIEEIRLLKDQYGIDSIFFHDDTFTINHAWVKEFCSQLDKSRLNILWGCNSRIDTVNEEILKIMYETGLRNIHFGIESASQRILDSIYNKQIKLEKITDVISLTNTIGISAMGFFMLGAPSETTQEINSTIAFARSLKLREASFSLTTPLAGTYLFQSLLKGGMFTMDKHYDNFNYYSKYTIKGGISCRQIKFLQLKAFLLFYLHPFRLKYIARHLLNPRGIRKLLNKVRRSL